MSAIHQIWLLDMEKGICTNFSGTSGEGNGNHSSNILNCTWAQPSGLTIGIGPDGDSEVYIADSESSTIRGINLETGKSSRNIVGGDGTATNLFAYGDTDGEGTDAKLQHPLGVHWLPDR